MPNVILRPAVWLKAFDDPVKAAKAWLAGRDFQIVGGPYCSIRDLDKLEQYGDVFIEYTPGEVFHVSGASHIVKKSELERTA